MKSSYNKVFVWFVAGCLLCAGIFLFAGCQGIANNKSLMISASGVKAETLLPDDVWMVMKMGSSDQNQIEKLDKLMDLFPADFIDYIIEEAATGFNEDNAKYGIDFKEDILPAVGENWQLMIAFSGGVSDVEEPVIMAIFMPADAVKIEEMMKKMPENGKGNEIKWNEYTFYSSESEDAYFVRHEDVILVSNDMDALKNAVSGQMKGSLLVNKSYQAGAAKAGENIGFMFVDPAILANGMMENVDEEEAEQADRMMEIMSVIDGEFFVLSAEEDGFRIGGTVGMDMAKWRELGLPDVKEQGKSYLYKRLPGEGVVVYSEGANLKRGLDMMIEMYKNIDEVTYGVSMIKAALAMQKIDYEKDLMAFMDRGFAFSMNQTENLIPSIGLYFDAESSPDGAKKVMNRIYEGIEELLAEGEMDEEIMASISNEKVDCGAGECYVFAMDFAKFPKEAREEMGEAFADEKLMMQYGLNDKNLAFFTLYPRFLEGDFETMEENVRFAEAMALIPNMDEQVSFIDIRALANFIDGWVQYGLKQAGTEGTEDMSEYETVMEYARPVQYFVSGVKTIGEGQMEMEAFIKISK